VAPARLFGIASVPSFGAIRNPQSAIRNPQSAIRNPQSAIRNPHKLPRAAAPKSVEKAFPPIIF